MKNEIACRSEENALVLAKILMEEEHVVMLSKEEDLTIVNYEYSEYSDRNNVVFMTVEEFEEEMFSDAEDGDSKDDVH